MRRSATRPTLSRRSQSSLPAIGGYAAVFYRAGDPSTEFEIASGAFERVMPGAFDSAFRRKDDVRALFNHDARIVLGRTKAATLTLTKDSIGLRYEIEPSQSTQYRDLVESVRRGDVDGSSFSFKVLNERWRRDGDKQVRELLDVELIDVGPVTFPAYAAATAGIASDVLAASRSAVEAERLERERFLRNAQLRLIEQSMRR